MYTSVYDIAGYSANGHGIDDSETQWRLPLDLLDRVVSIFPHLPSLRLSIRQHCPRGSRRSQSSLSPGYSPVESDEKCPRSDTVPRRRLVCRILALESMTVIRLRIGHGGADVAATCALHVPRYALVGLSKGASDDEGIVQLASLDGRLTRIVVAPIEECWDRLILGALLVSQFWHLTILSVVHLAWDGLLSCGLTALPSLRALRVEFAQLTQAPRGFAQASAEGVAYLHCPALLALMLEAERSITVSTKTLAGFLRDLDAPTDRMTLALRRVEIWDAEPPEERTQFARIVVDAARGEHTDWLARADGLLVTGSTH